MLIQDRSVLAFIVIWTKINLHVWEWYGQSSYYYYLIVFTDLLNLSSFNGCKQLLCQIQVVVNNHQYFLFDTDRVWFYSNPLYLALKKSSLIQGLWFSLICCWLMIKTRAAKRKTKAKQNRVVFLGSFPLFFKVVCDSQNKNVDLGGEREMRWQRYPFPPCSSWKPNWPIKNKGLNFFFLVCGQNPNTVVIYYIWFWTMKMVGRWVP